MGLVKTSHPPYSFTIEQYDGLLAASLSATIISLLASFAGLLVHFILLWYDHHRPDNNNYATHFGNNKTTTTTTTTGTSSHGGKETTTTATNGGDTTTTGKNNNHLNAIQHGHYDTSPVMKPQKAHRRGGGIFKKGSSTGAMNRVSLRLIVLACISYSIYSVSQLVVTGIPESALACRVLAYFIICFDVMGSLFLGLVGFNLVLVFVVNVKHPERFEKYYYGFALLVSIFVIVPPLVLKAGRTIDKSDSCWYHFFFEGRQVNHFNWLYYYSWLLFASILAAVTALIAIRKVILEKNNFAHTINMLNREEASYPRPGMYPVASSASTHFQRNTNRLSTPDNTTTQQQTYSKMSSEKNSDLFRRVAIRCICYALVPVLCKSWGIGIEIAIASGIVVNYPILVIDRFMACIMGFCVSCIYFTDPSVQMVWNDMMIDYQKRYVDQFYYVDVTKVIRFDTHHRQQRQQQHQDEQEGHQAETIDQRKDESANRMRQWQQQTVYTIMNFSSTTNKRAKSNSVPDPVYIDDSALKRPMKYHPPATSINIFSCCKHSHNEVMSEKHSSSILSRHHSRVPSFLFPHQCIKLKEKNSKWVPMRRIDAPVSRSSKATMDDTHSIDSYQSEDMSSMHMRTSGLLYENGVSVTNHRKNGSKNGNLHDYKRNTSRLFEPYSHPTLAKCVYWFFVHLLFYRPPYYHRQKRAFERRKGKDKAITILPQHRQQHHGLSGNHFPIDTSSVEESYSSKNEYTTTTDGGGNSSNDENTPTSGSNDGGGKQNNKHPILFMEEESTMLPPSPSPMSQGYAATVTQPKFIPSEPKTTSMHQQRATNNKAVVLKHEPNSATLPPSPSHSTRSLFNQQNQSTESMYKKTQRPQRPPLLHIESKSRSMSSSLIKSNHEKAIQAGKHTITTEQARGRRSSSFPSSTEAIVPVAASSSSRLPSTPLAKASPKQHVKTKASSHSLHIKDTTSSSSSTTAAAAATAGTTEKSSFLNQKLARENLHEHPSHRHIPTIGHLIQSVSPVHSFMAVRRAAASSFALPPTPPPTTTTTQPSSSSSVAMISGPSSLQSSPVAMSTLSLSSSSVSSSSPSSLRKQQDNQQIRPGTATSGEKQDALTRYQNQRKYYAPLQWSSPQNRLYQHHVLYHDYSNRSSPSSSSRQKPRHPMFLTDDRSKKDTERPEDNDELGPVIQGEKNCPYCTRQYNDINAHELNDKGKDIGLVDMDNEQNAKKGAWRGGEELGETTCIETPPLSSLTNDKTLTMACIQDYHRAYLGSSTSLSSPLPICEDPMMTCQSYISGHQYQQAPFFIEGGGLSPPSKQHYAFLYSQGERISPKGPRLAIGTVSKSPSSSPKFQVPSIIREKEKDFNGQTKKHPATDPIMKNAHSSKARRKKSKLEKTRQGPDPADKEILFSGVRTILLHIKDDMEMHDDRPDIELQQQEENDRIDMVIGNWEVGPVMYHS